MTPEEKEDIRQAVAYHREHGGYESHGRSCRCAACRLVRVVDYVGEVEAAVEAMWDQMDRLTVDMVREVRPEAVALAQRLHEERNHGEVPE